MRQDHLLVEALAQVQYVASDNASDKMMDALKRVCPNIICLCLDTVHLPMVYEYASYRRLDASV